MPDKNRFDILIVSKSVDPNAPPKRGWLSLLASEPELNHWRVRVLTLPQVESPLQLGQEYVLPMELFNFGTFLGDTVEIEWDGQWRRSAYHGAQTCAHGYMPKKRARGPSQALEALREQLAEVSGAVVPLVEVAGRFKWASHLLDQVMGEVSWRRSCPKNAGPVADQLTAIELTAAICRALEPKRFHEVARTFGGFDHACQMLLKAAGQKTQADQLYWANLALQVLPVFMPERKASDRQVESVRNLLAMAAEADRNYGPGTGERALEKVFGMGK